VSRRPARFTEAEARSLLEEAQSRTPPMTIAIKVGGKLEIVPLDEPKVDPPSVVYFVSYGTAIKIGYSTNLRKRLGALQAGVPERVVLEFSCAGDMRMEKELHQRFARDRLHSEWFRYSDTIKAWIEAKRA
jgi:hypothetical protein